MNVQRWKRRKKKKKKAQLYQQTVPLGESHNQFAAVEMVKKAVITGEAIDQHGALHRIAVPSV